MLKGKWLSAIIALLLCLTLSPVHTSAAEAPAFTMRLDQERHELGQMMTVTVEASGLTDLYGFELVFGYDQTRLKLLGANSQLKGFSIKPIAGDGGQIVFAHTKTGAVAGDNGALTLCTLTFEALAEGETSVRLISAKLVDSKLKASQPTARTELTSVIGKPIVRHTFTDLEGHWAKAKVERAADLGIAAGYADGTFRPNRPVTRAEFAAMLARALVLDLKKAEQAAFKDQAELPVWSRPYVAAVAAEGYIKGYADGTFRPNQLITRAEMTVILTRALNVIAEPGKQAAFADRASIPAWAEPSIAAAVDMKLVQGKGANTFAPNDTATRAEAVTLLLRMLDQRVVAADAS
jgi:hypothetical protein